MANIYEGLGNRQPQWKLDFIKENGAVFTAKQMSRHLVISESFIYNYCAYHGIPIKKQDVEEKRMYGPITKKITTYVKKEPLVRPKAVYDNKSREEIINHYLELSI